MVSKVLSAAVTGLEADIVQVEVHFTRGKNRFFIVGLPDKACSESKERVMAIIRNFLNHRVKSGTITVNLSPADVLKSGPIYDLPIAIAILDSLKKIHFDHKNKLIVGELSLDGKARFTSSILPIAEMASKKGLNELYVPSENAHEASLIDNIQIRPVKNLSSLVNHIQKKEYIPSYSNGKKGIINKTQASNAYQDLKDIRGQQHAKRALEIAASGNHNLLMVGSPGSGKTMMAKAISSIMPKMDIEEKLEVTKIHSVAGLLSRDVTLIHERPFRNPHHTTSYAALVGGGTIPKPGEVSLSHRGILFLDEFTEFSSKSIESLRQPLEDGVITISRAKKTLEFPAEFMLISAMNPCKCGWFGDNDRDCICSSSEIQRYKKKLSGPILDRIDMQINVNRASISEINTVPQSESSETVRQRVQRTRNIQKKRFRETGIYTNGEMSSKLVKKHVSLDKSTKDLLERSATNMCLSTRSYFKILKISRTIADMEGSKDVLKTHIIEALSYRMLEKN